MNEYNEPVVERFWTITTSDSSKFNNWMSAYAYAEGNYDSKEEAEKAFVRAKEAGLCQHSKYHVAQFEYRRI